MKEGALIRFLLIALPAGLLALGVGAMFVSHERAKTIPTDPNEAIRLETASLKRRPVAREDLSRSLDMLSHRIGERNPDKPASLESAALWFESTVGPANLGYLVERHVFELGGREVRNLIVELPGRDRRKEIIVVGAHYDTISGDAGGKDNASGVAALVALARAFAGDPQGRTIRFAAFVNGVPSPTDTSGSLLYANRCRARGEAIVAMLALDSLGSLPDGGTLSFWGAEDSYYFVDSAQAAFAKATSLPTSTPGATGSDSPLLSATLDQRAFSQAGYPAVAAYVSPPPSQADDPDILTTITIGLESVLRFWANP